MLVLNPWRVRFGDTVWDGVVGVTVDRSATRELISWDDAGPEVAFADAPERRVTVTVTQSLASDDFSVPRPGDAGDLVVFASPAGSEAQRRRVTVPAVVLRVTHDVSLRQRGGSRAAEVTRKIVLIGVSSDGVADPVSVEAVSGSPV